MCLHELLLLTLVLDEENVLESGRMLVSLLPQLVDVILEHAVPLVELVHEVWVRVAIRLTVEDILFDQG